MLRLVLVVGLLAGLAAGLATAVLQHFTTVPLILEAETYEIPVHDHGDAAQSAFATNGEDDHAAAPGAADGLSRSLSTAAATVVSAIGFALVLIAAMLLGGAAITPLTALAWSAGAFAATGLATGLGLPPELPGSAGGDLVARQAWWFFAAGATAAGLYSLVRVRTAAAIAVGVALLLAPHLVGAPLPSEGGGTAPAELAARFASTSLAMHAAFWALVGIAVGTLWQRLDRTREASAP